MFSYNIYVPTSFDIISFKNKNSKNLMIIIYNNSISLKLWTLIDIVKIDLESYSLKFFIENKDKIKNIHYFLNWYNNFLKTFELYFFIKIKFKGKGFKIKFNKKNKLIKFYFGKSHLTFYKLKKIKLKRVTKYKFVLKSNNWDSLKRNSLNMTFIKPVNIYTLRGIRISRQWISKRKGKKSSYV